MKKKVTLEQLRIDGIAQLKTYQQIKSLINQPLKKGSDHIRPFINDPELSFREEMFEMLGKSVKVGDTTFGADKKRVGLLNNKGHIWYFPIECVAK